MVTVIVILTIRSKITRSLILQVLGAGQRIVANYIFGIAILFEGKNAIIKTIPH
jgi:hypothetical protein